MYSSYVCIRLLILVYLPPFRAQSFRITLPKDLECKGCTVRLIREAREWGKTYKFWSCADVDIVPRKAVFLGSFGAGCRMYLLSSKLGILTCSIFVRWFIDT